MKRIYGIKKVVHTMNNWPSGYWYEVFACKTDKGYKVWTVGPHLIGAGAQTIYANNTKFIRINYAAARYALMIARREHRYPSRSECIREVIKIAFPEEDNQSRGE